MTKFDITKHLGSTPPDLSLLVEAAATEGFDFVERTVTEWASGENRFDQDRASFWLAVADLDRAIGMCGITIDPYVGNPMVGRLRHLYVSPEHRGSGIGAELVATVMRFAEGRFHTVRLRTPGERADRFYDDYGFDRSASDTATHEMFLS